ncbi:3-carboxy-cis,cis-muconate cycloisomerase [Bartonella sp. HY038]|uniref:3-carboxy-cis,cis-muconate cycloisomerase n=1 Tax=Bartonella sp. HY038 TaxID=2759660 RepID=UPI001FEEF277|nr:3-carboxy-cis,cis-muconate cycloisomerase [Bartonella sp. HY038]
MLVDDLVKDTEIAAFFTKKAEIAAMVKVEFALAKAQEHYALITKEALAVIDDACQTFSPDLNGFAAAMAKDGVAVPELLRQLRQNIAPQFQKFLHLGATSQDIIDTGLMLRLSNILDIFEQRIKTLIALLADMQTQQGATPLMAHTRMQVALPFTVFDKIQQWKALLQDICADFGFYRQKILRLQLAGPIGNGMSFDGNVSQIANFMAKDLGLNLPHSWQSDRKPIIDAGHFLSLISGALGKIGQDIALLAQNEVGELVLQGGGASSAMAHKHNPIAAETLVAIGRFNAGLMGALHQSMIHENERSGAAWTLEWLVLPQICQASGAALLLAAEVLNGAKFINTVKS